ncbi:MAG: DUF1883 domain-containing protein [Planctomycetota bacterium]|nr:MAG: DUF1883 domain-containing protein [Planctomycetota bacterium]
MSSTIPDLFFEYTVYSYGMQPNRNTITESVHQSLDQPGVVVSFKGTGTLLSCLQRHGFIAQALRSVRRALVHGDMDASLVSKMQDPQAHHHVIYADVNRATEIYDRINNHMERLTANHAGQLIGNSHPGQWRFKHFRLQPENGGRLEVKLRKPANVLIVDPDAYENYRNGRPFRFNGGWVQKTGLLSTAYCELPPGPWQVVLDLVPERTDSIAFMSNKRARIKPVDYGLDALRPKVLFPVDRRTYNTGSKLPSTCSACGGFGTYALGSEAMGSKGNYNRFHRPCPVCGGSGNI